MSDNLFEISQAIKNHGKPYRTIVFKGKHVFLHHSYDGTFLILLTRHVLSIRLKSSFMKYAGDFSGRFEILVDDKRLGRTVTMTTRLNIRTTLKMSRPDPI